MWVQHLLFSYISGLNVAKFSPGRIQSAFESENGQNLKEQSAFTLQKSIGAEIVLHLFDVVLYKYKTIQFSWLLVWL